MLEFTSRGAYAEFWCEIKHLLHAEGHLEEMMSNAAREGNDSEVLELSKLLDEIRNIRQIVVQMCLNKSPETESIPCPRCQADLQTRQTSGLGNVAICPKCKVAIS